MPYSFAEYFADSIKIAFKLYTFTCFSNSSSLSKAAKMKKNGLYSTILTLNISWINKVDACVTI